MILDGDTHARIHASVSSYYTDTSRRHGATAREVDWKSSHSQAIRFEQLLTLFDLPKPFSINDFGCGYGALVALLESEKLEFTYCCCDLSESMLTAAHDHHPGRPGCNSVPGGRLLQRADYTVASGIFNVRLDFSTGHWRRYVRSTLHRMAGLSKLGLSFNALTTYSDEDFLD